MEADKPKPPPPPGPPPAAVDLETVYRPDEDPLLKQSIKEHEIQAPATGHHDPVLADLEDLLRGEQTSAPQAASVDLVGIGEGPKPEPAPQQDLGLLSELPATVSASHLTEQKAVVINLSAPAAEEKTDKDAAPVSAGEPPSRLSRSTPTPFTAAAPAEVTPAAASRGAASSSAPRTIPQDAKGFGSEDLFGADPSQKEWTYEGVKEDAEAVLHKVVGCLPEPAKKYIPITVSEEPSAQAAVPQHQFPGSTDMERQHYATAVDRACEGRWVPTYMRKQMAENGHTTIPTVPNAHEFNASEPPPSLSQAFAEMGEEFGSSAQNAWTFVLAFLSGLALQCQMCTHNAATSTHDAVLICGDNICRGGLTGSTGEEEGLLGPLPNEANAGLGPVRSRASKTLPGVGFAPLLQAIRKEIADTGDAEPGLRSIRSRRLNRQVVDASRGNEDWVFNTDLERNVLPTEALQHVCHGRLHCRERWHIQAREERASAEICNDSAEGAVLVALRVDITGRPEAEGGGCEVDSRLYARSGGLGVPLPVGLVEQLIEAHHAYSESLRSLTATLAGEAEPANERAVHPEVLMGPSGGVAQVAPQEKEPLPVVHWPVPEKRPPSWAAEGPRQPSIGQGSIDASLLMQVANGI